MKTLIVSALIGGAALFAVAQKSDEGSAKDNSAETYENLATAIIAIRKTEDGLVKGIIEHSRHAADRALDRAGESKDNAEKKQLIEQAAADITNMANEGDKPVLAVRQRLSKAGHTHNTDADTKEDYLWINSKEKKQLLDLARRVSQTGAGTSANELRKLSNELGEISSKALAAE